MNQQQASTTKPNTATAQSELDRKFGDDQEKRDIVEQASWESFPASDPAY
jgi:hypothetical protein